LGEGKYTSRRESANTRKKRKKRGDGKKRGVEGSTSRGTDGEEQGGRAKRERTREMLVLVLMEVVLVLMLMLMLMLRMRMRMRMITRMRMTIAMTAAERRRRVVIKEAKGQEPRQTTTMRAG